MNDAALRLPTSACGTAQVRRLCAVDGSDDVDELDRAVAEVYQLSDAEAELVGDVAAGDRRFACRAESGTEGAAFNSPRAQPWGGGCGVIGRRGALSPGFHPGLMNDAALRLPTSLCDTAPMRRLCAVDASDGSDDVDELDRAVAEVYQLSDAETELVRDVAAPRRR